MYMDAFSVLCVWLFVFRLDVTYSQVAIDDRFSLYGSPTRSVTEQPTFSAIGNRESLVRNEFTTHSSTMSTSESRPDGKGDKACDKSTHKGCDIKNNERCTEKEVCVCMMGYLRSADTNKCIAAQFFTGVIRLENEYRPELVDQKSDQYINLAVEVRNALFEIFGSKQLAGLLDIQILTLRQGSVIVEFEIALNRQVAPELRDLQQIYQDGLTTMTSVIANGSILIRDTGLFLSRSENISSQSRTLREFNHCVDAFHNYCDVNAVCTHSMKSFICQCSGGYKDMSIDKVNSAGERCEAAADVYCGCENNGTCDIEKGETVCRCQHWYLGKYCEINGKELLFIICGVLGGVVILTALLCVACICSSRNKKRRNHRSNAIAASSLDSSIIKLPRLWMEHGRHGGPYEFPPRDGRRWSYVSDPVMDDFVHAETLPLPRSHEAKRKYLAAYQNPSYSATLPIRPPY